MFRTTYRKVVVVVLIFCLSLIACGGRETPVTELEQIVGTWEAYTSGESVFKAVIDIQPDGTVKSAGSLEKLNQGITDTSRFWVEDEQIHVEGPPVLCDAIGLYQAVIHPDGKLKFTTIEDPCSWRMGVMDRSQPGNMNEYVIEFILVR